MSEYNILQNGVADGGSSDGDTISGIVDSIVYRSDESGYTVCIVEDEQGLPVTAVGTMPYLSEGDRLTAHGKWITHRTYGRQFSVETFERSLPAEEGDILRYLASGAVRGIGPKTAQKIVEKFGTDSFDVIENNPEWLASISGISRASAAFQAPENFSCSAATFSLPLLLCAYISVGATLQSKGSAKIRTASAAPTAG